MMHPVILAVLRLLAPLRKLRDSALSLTSKVIYLKYYKNSN